MNLHLEEHQIAVRDRALRAATELLAPSAAAFDRDERFPADNLRELARRGLFGVNIDPAHGGAGAGVVAYALAVRALAGGCAGTTVAMMVTNMVAEAIQAWGNDAQKRRWLPAICGGEMPAAAFSLSEPGAGSDAAGLRTTAVRDGDHYVLNGTKAWVTSGGHAGVYLVMARTDPEQRSRGISAFLVEPGLAGFTVPRPEDKMGLRASATTQLVFEDCRVPASARLGDEGVGFKVAMSSLDGGRVGVSAQACGIANAALVAALKWTLENNLYVQRLHEAAAELEAGWLLCLRAASLKDAGRRLTREAAMSKVFCTEMAGRVCQAALEAVGEAGLTPELPIERHLRDVRVTRIYEGTSEVQRIVVARELLRGAAA